MPKSTKESIIEILNNISLDDKTLEEVHNLIKVDPLHVGQLSEHLNKLEFLEHDELAKKLCIMDHSEVIGTLIRRSIEEKDIPKQTKFNLASLCRSKGIAVDEEVLSKLMHFKPKSTVLVGKGEALFRILMKGTPITTGDFGASGKKFEVKFNRSRLRGMNGFRLSDASQVASTLDTLFIRQCNLLGFDAKRLIGTKPNRWNFSSGSRKKPYLLSTIIRLSGMTPISACKLFVAAFMKYYYKCTKIEIQQLISSLSKEFNSNGVIETKGYSNFIYKMCAFSMKYYARVEGFDGMLVLNEHFDCLYITRKFIDSSSLESLSKFIRENLKIIPPNLTSKAGVQGSSFGIF